MSETSRSKQHGTSWKVCLPGPQETLLCKWHADTVITAIKLKYLSCFNAVIFTVSRAMLMVSMSANWFVFLESCLEGAVSVLRCERPQSCWTSKFQTNLIVTFWRHETTCVYKVLTGSLPVLPFFVFSPTLLQYCLCRPLLPNYSLKGKIMRGATFLHTFSLCAYANAGDHSVRSPFFSKSYWSLMSTNVSSKRCH